MVKRIGQFGVSTPEGDMWHARRQAVTSARSPLPRAAFLASDVSSGTTITVTYNLSGILPNSYVLVGAGATSAELRRVSAVSGDEITVDRAIANSHTAGDPVLLLATSDVSVWMFGAAGDDSTNDTTAFQNALDELDDAGGGILFVGNGTYRVASLDIPNDSQISCANLAQIKGVLSTDYIIVSSGETIRISIIGGKWTDCARVWSHTGSSALADCFFSDMNIFDADYGFYLSSSVGSHWDGCRFGNGGSAGNMDYGFYFENTGACNINTIRRCRFRHTNDYCVYFNEGSSQNFVLNKIVDCWFEQVNSGGAIFLGNYSLGNTIEKNFFEEAGDSTTPDITIDASSAICRFNIINNRFSPETSGQIDHRIYVDGNTSGVISHNTVVLVSGSNFVECDHFQPNTLWLNYNYLNATGGGSYESRLFNNTSSGYVNWNVVSSGVVSDDDTPHSYQAGGVSQGFFALDNNDTTPTVIEGNLFTCGNAALTTITDFDDGREGQRIEIHFTNGNTTVSDNANIVLAGSANWNPAATDTLTLRLRSGVWYETSRSDNS